LNNSRRIVLANEFWFGSTGEGLAHGLRKLEWDICAVNTCNHFLTARSLSLRLLSRVIFRLSIASYNAAVLDAVKTLKPLAFLTVKGLYLTPETLLRIRRLGVMTIMYYPDFHFTYRGLDQATFRLYDYFFTTKSFQLPFLRERLGIERVQFLPHGYSCFVHYPRFKRVSEIDYLTDCLYIGTYSRYKAHWLERIACKLPNLKLAVGGSGWRKPAKNTPLERFVLGFPLLGDQYSRALQAARINLAIHLGPTACSNGWQDLVSTRTFEIPACKGFMLHADNVELRDLFEPGKEIDVFRSEEELCEKITFYLARPDLRREMIERAYMRAVPAYSYNARAKVIADTIVRHT
jgi:spore maturation protein CgeB